MYDVIVIGAGASGLVSAIISARRGKQVLILEKNERLGKKLLATGNGRCNITNRKINSKRFHSQNFKFISRTLNGYDYKRIEIFFNSIGLELREGKEGKVFPMSLQASSVVELLECELKELGVEIILNAKVENVVKNRRNFQVIYNSLKIKSKSVVIATGSPSAPQLGGGDDGFKFAQNFGHRIIKSSPSLVQLTSSMPNLKRVAGVKLSSKVKFKSMEIFGDILFTKYGISGLAILDISRKVVQELRNSKSTTLILDLMPQVTHKRLKEIIEKGLVHKPTRDLETILKGILNKKLITFILRGNDNSIEQVVRNIKSFKFKIDGSRGFKGAEVATGGVDTVEINPKTMESKRVKGLYFCGEILDIDGDRGGFNLHFAWVSGIRVGSFI